MSARVVITLGNMAEARITADGRLVIVQVREGGLAVEGVDLGQATTQRFADLISHLHRLSIHAVDIKD